MVYLTVDIASALASLNFCGNRRIERIKNPGEDRIKNDRSISRRNDRRY